LPFSFIIIFYLTHRFYLFCSGGGVIVVVDVDVGGGGGGGAFFCDFTSYFNTKELFQLIQ